MLKLLNVVVSALVFISAGVVYAQAGPPKKDDRRRCYELRRLSICDEKCGIKPPCVTSEEAARQLSCARDLVDGVADQDCNPIVLPVPPGAPNDGISFNVKITHPGVFYWNAWSNCKSCSWTLDEVVIDPKAKTYQAFLNSTEVTRSKQLTTFGALDDKGWGRQTHYGGAMYKFVYFNPKLCKTSDPSTCYPVPNVIVVGDHPQSEARIYSSFQEFDKAEDNPFSCDISTLGEATCKFNISGH